MTLDAAELAPPDKPSPKARSSDLGRPILAGIGAWAVTVASFLFAEKSAPLTRVLAILPLAFLGAAAFAERKGDRRALRLTLFWGFPLAAAAPIAYEGHVPGRPDGTTALFGIVAWGFFAFAGASGTFVAERSPAERRERRIPWDTVLLGTASLAALSFQAIGWSFAGTERALLVRIVAIGTGITVVSLATHYLLERNTLHEAASARSRGGPAVRVFLVLFLLLTGPTILYLLR